MSSAIPLSYTVILVAYLLVCVVIGAVFVRASNRSLLDYLVAYRGLSWFPILATNVATLIGGGVFIQLCYLGYKVGIWALANTIIFMGGYALFIIFVLPRVVRATKKATVSQIIGDRFGPLCGKSYGILTVMRETGATAAQLIALAVVIITLLPVSLGQAIVIGAVVMGAYTVMSGMYGVVMTDVFQFFGMVLGVVVMLLVLPSRLRAGGGLGSLPPELFSLGNYAAFFREFRFGPWSNNLVLSLVFYCMIYASSQIVCNQTYQRVFASKDALTARRGFVNAIWLGLFLSAVPVYMGLAARLLYPSGINPMQAYPILAANLIPGPLAALFLGAVVAAIMSTADSYLISGAGVLVKDVFEAEDDQEHKKASTALARWSVTGIITLATLLALYFKALIPALMFGWTVIASGGLPVVLATFFWRRATSAAALSSILAGGIISLVWEFVLKCPLSLPAIVPGLAGSALALVLVTFLTQIDAGRLERFIEEYGWKSALRDKQSSSAGD